MVGEGWGACTKHQGNSVMFYMGKRVFELSLFFFLSLFSQALFIIYWPVGNVLWVKEKIVFRTWKWSYPSSFQLCSSVQLWSWWVSNMLKSIMTLQREEWKYGCREMEKEMYQLLQEKRFSITVQGDNQLWNNILRVLRFQMKSERP